MISASKNLLTGEHIRELTAYAFPGRYAADISELTAGLCNALYVVTLDNGTKTVLKVSSPGMEGKTTNEQWLIESETASMKMVAEHLPGLPAPKVLFYDDSMTRCSGKYFFMEFLEGDLMMPLRRTLTQEQSKARYHAMGRAVRDIGTIKHHSFGIVNSGIEFDSLYGVVNQLIGNITGDMEACGADMGVTGDELLARLLADKPYFDEVTEASLVHFDIWENNILVSGNKITGIVDWDRALWGEPLMEDRFRVYGMNPDFLEGFGQTEFSESEQRRLTWYNLWIHLAFMGEHFSRKYDTEEDYRNNRAGMLNFWNKLTGQN